MNSAPTRNRTASSRPATGAGDPGTTAEPTEPLTIWYWKPDFWTAGFEDLTADLRQEDRRQTS